MPKPVRESREEQSFCWLAMMPIHALEWLGLSPTTLNPSLLQLGCREACEPISNFHVLRPTELLQYFPSAIRESRPACWWQWIWADCRSSYRGRSWRWMFSSWSVTFSLVSQSQYCLLKVKVVSTSVAPKLGIVMECTLKFKLKKKYNFYFLIFNKI